MSKIICEVCGTSYPETAAQCPICGCVRPGDAQSVSGEQDDRTSSGGYTYVKGGRFSKANVRKRNRGVQVTTSAKSSKKEKEENEKNTGLIITIIVLLLAIIAVIAYIIVKFFLPDTPAASDSSGNTSGDTGNSIVEEATVSCTDILLDTDQIILEAEGETVTLHVNVLPANTTDAITFSSSDENVAVVDSEGVITAVGAGEAMITVSCGAESVECMVRCDIEDPTDDSSEDNTVDFRLNRQQITFQKAGSSWVIYSGSIPVSDIVWTTDDASVATVSNGRVVAVGEGTTTVYGEFNGSTQSCQIICEFTDSGNTGHEGNGGVSEDGGIGENDGQDTSTDNGEYHLDNLFSQYDTEVTISVGDWFPLQLVDSYGNKVEATWSVEDSNICTVDGGDVTAVGSGNTYVIATYNGQEYRCLVRVL